MAEERNDANSRSEQPTPSNRKWHFWRRFTVEGEEGKEKWIKAEALKLKAKEDEAKLRRTGSILEPYDVDDTILRNVGLRNKPSKMIAAFRTLAALSFLIFIGSLDFAFVDTTWSNPNQTALALAPPALIAMIFFGLTTVVAKRVTRAKWRRFYRNTIKVIAHLSDFLGRRWRMGNTDEPPTFYGMKDPEPEPFGKELLDEKKKNIEDALNLANKRLLDIEVGVIKKSDGTEVPLSEGEKEEARQILNNSINTYTAVIKDIAAFSEGHFVLNSMESKDYDYVWENGVLTARTGFKFFLVSPGPSLLECLDEKINTSLENLGDGIKEEIRTMEFNAIVDWGYKAEQVTDPDTGSKAFVETPVYAIRNTPHQGLFYSGTARDGMISLKVMHLPDAAVLLMQHEEDTNRIARLEDKVLDLNHEAEMVDVLKGLEQPSRPASISMVQPMKETLSSGGQQQQQPVSQNPQHVKHWNPFRILGFVLGVGACFLLFGAIAATFFHVVF